MLNSDSNPETLPANYVLRRRSVQHALGTIFDADQFAERFPAIALVTREFARRTLDLSNYRFVYATVSAVKGFRNPVEAIVVMESEQRQIQICLTRDRRNAWTPAIESDDSIASLKAARD